MRECNSSIYVFRGERLWPALERLEPHNAQGELYLTDAVRFLVEDGETVAAHVAADPAETEGVNTRAELAAAAALLRDRINLEHMLAGVTIVDPATTWIERDGRDRGGRRRPSVHRPARRDAGRRGRRDPPARGRDRRHDRGGCDRRAVLLPSPRHRPGRPGEGRHLRGDQELAHRAADEGAPSLVHRRRRDRRGHERRRRRHHRELPAPARTAEAPHDDREQRQDRHPQWVRRARDRGRRCVDRSRIGDHRGRAARRARDRPAAPGEQGGPCRPRRRRD